MSADCTHSDGSMTNLLERLVSGDLDEADRGRVIGWLEADPRRWRMCGLAFLEAQAWSAALARWPQGAAARSAEEKSRDPRRAPASKRRFAAAAPYAIAASVLAAFALGLAIGNLPQRSPQAERRLARDADAGNRLTEPAPTASPGRDKQAPVLASVNILPGAGLPVPASVQFPVVPGKTDTAPGAGGWDKIPDYVRQQWERKGFKVSLERRYLPARLPDGQQVVVLVEQLRLNPVPLIVN